MTTATRDLAVDREAVRKAARLLFERGEVIEVRALGVKRGDRDRPHVEAGYFDNGDAALAAIEEIAPHARGCYWTLHRLKPDLLARRANRMDRVGTGETTGDDHVVRLRHLLIDIDPQRLSGISATDDEHRAAQDTVKQITESLMAAGWREPLIIDTGNGAGIIYRIDQPPENAALIRRSLEALAARFNTPTVEVDTAVWNPSRLAKIPGTPVAKGDHTTERPHRRSAILSAPKRLETVSHDLLKSLATQAPAKPEPERHSPNRANGPSLDVLKFLSDAGIGVRHEAAYADGSLHRLKECPCCGSQGGNAYVIQFGNGALCAGCFESDCALDWQWLREHFEDVYRAQAPVSPNGRHPDERPDVADENTVHVVTFHTAAEVVASAPENTDWIARGYAARQGITEIAATIKSGKTAFNLSLCAAVISGRPFLGQPTSKSRVIYLTEERGPSFGLALKKAGLDASDDLIVVHKHECTAIPWEEVVAQVGQIAHAKAVGLVIVDTLAKWAGLKDDTENSSGAAVAAMEPLERIAASGLAVIVDRHDRKGGGELGESARGSSAFGGMADILLHLVRARQEGHPNRRVLTGVGRFDDTPEKLIIEMQDSGEYVALGENAAVEREDALRFLRETLPTDQEAAWTRQQIKEEIHEQSFSMSTVERVLKERRAAGEFLSKKGFGEKGTAEGFWRNPSFLYRSDPEKKESEVSPPSGSEIARQNKDFRDTPPEKLESGQDEGLSHFRPQPLGEKKESESEVRF